MSPRAADRLCISLAPDAIALARPGGVCRIAAGGLAALRAEIGREGRSRATVVLSNRMVRYAVVPFDRGVSGADEELALARFHFTRVHGERAKAWDIRLGEVHGASRLACAVDAGLVEAIRGCFPAGGKAKLVSIQPYLMAAYNRARSLLGKAPAWLALLERGRACLALASREGWQAVGSVRLQEDAEPGLLDLLEREALRCPVASPRRALVHGARVRATGGWEVLQLDDGPYAMALSAL